MTEESHRPGTQIQAQISALPNERDALAHIPPLPPLPDLTALLPHSERATVVLDRLNAMVRSKDLPQLSFVLSTYAKRESTPFSQIEGARPSFEDILFSEDHDDDAFRAHVKNDLIAVHECYIGLRNYAGAWVYGVEQLFLLPRGLPLCLRLVRELHKRLLEDSMCGGSADPGEFRKVQNHIGKDGPTPYEPPPVEDMKKCLDNFEKRLADTSSELPLLVQAAILHAQFEAIHPFLDGNGRVGRLLIGLFLCQHKLLLGPFLYLNLHFKRHRAEYYDRLNGIHKPGGWEAWIKFFLEGVHDTVLDVCTETEELQAFSERERERLVALGRKGETALRIHEELLDKMILSAPRAAELTQRSYASALNALLTLEEMGIVCEVTGQKRNRVFAYRKYMDTLAEDTTHCLEAPLEAYGLLRQSGERAARRGVWRQASGKRGSPD